MAELQVALRFDPNQPRALATLASLISQKGDQEKALQFCQRALQLAPKYAPACNNLGLIYRRQEKLDLAEKQYLKALELEPRLDAAHINLAQLYVRQGKNDESIEQFRLAVRANRGNPNPIALANLGVYHFNRKEYRKAFAFYRRALQADADYALVHKYIASIYALAPWDRPDLAVYHLRRSLQLDPGQADAGELRFLLERAEQAAAERQRAAPAAPATQTPSTNSDEQLQP